MNSETTKLNARITVLFTRHAQYNKTGLTPAGHIAATQFGNTLDPHAVIVSHAGPIPRNELTAAAIVTAARTQSKQEGPDTLAPERRLGLRCEDVSLPEKTLPGLRGYQEAP